MGTAEAAMEELVTDRPGMPGEPSMRLPLCRLCATPLDQTFVDLGLSPLANSYVAADELFAGETFYPLHVFVCGHCMLVQLPEVASPRKIFSDYAYFSSYSDSWLEHARAYVEMAVERFGLHSGSQVIEVASNDGYLLQYFLDAAVPVLGIEPAANVAAVAIAKGVPTRVDFFGAELGSVIAAETGPADLVLGNNVLAHVPDIHDFVEGLRRVVKPSGVITMEFPHLLRILEQRQFDTIYHEHFSYFTLHTVERLFEAHGLSLFDVDELPTHGGSLRIYVGATGERAVTERLMELRERERTAGLHELRGYTGFGAEVRALKRDLLTFLIEARRGGSSVAAYGAAAKGNTLLNFCGIRSDLVDYVVDKSPHKQGKFLPGTRLPIHAPSHVEKTKPNLLLILSWNIRAEVMEQMAHIRLWGGRFVVPIPEVVVFD
jgi:SAM-dependent methyltransferase